MKRLGPLGVIGLVMLACVFGACLLSSPYTLGRDADGPRYDHQDKSARLLPPWWAAATVEERKAHEAGGVVRRAWLGTDVLGRDLLVRSLAGGVVSLGIGLAAAMISVVIGTGYGALAGWVGGRVDGVMMRAVDVLYGLPYVLLVVLLAVAVDALMDRRMAQAGAEAMGDAGRAAVGIGTLLVAIGGVSWLTMARVVRGQVLSLRARPFIEAARAVGVPGWRIFARHLLPNLAGPIIVYATLTVPQAILQESFLSFLGIGVRPPMPSWGTLTADGLSVLNPVRVRWWLLAFPCGFLACTLVALNFLGEALRSRLDPTSGA